MNKEKIVKWWSRVAFVLWIWLWIGLIYEQLVRINYDIVGFITASIGIFVFLFLSVFFIICLFAIPLFYLGWKVFKKQ